MRITKPVHIFTESVSGSDVKPTFREFNNVARYYMLFLAGPLGLVNRDLTIWVILIDVKYSG